MDFRPEIDFNKINIERNRVDAQCSTLDVRLFPMK